VRLVFAVCAAVFVLASACGRGPDGCYRGGCSGELCGEPLTFGVLTPCAWFPAFACYDTATCERQPDGTCGFTPSSALSACLADAGSP
jgi:hypothetical protein